MSNKPEQSNVAEHKANKASFGKRGSCKTQSTPTKIRAVKVTPTQRGRVRIPAIATPSKVPCAMVSAKKDMRRQSIKQPNGAVRKTKSVPMIHAGNSSCNHSIMI